MSKLFYKLFLYACLEFCILFIHLENTATQKADCCPKTRFINREGIDFSDAESMQAVQVFTCEYFAYQNTKNNCTNAETFEGMGVS